MGEAGVVTQEHDSSAAAAVLADLCERAIPQALALAGSQAFLDWMQAQADEHPEIGPDLDADDRRRLLFWLGRSLWDCLPLPDHHFRPQPLPRPRRNEACPCGSGRKFKQCCAQLIRVEVPSPESLIQRALPCALDAKQRAALAQDPRAPLGLRLAVAEHAAGQDAHPEVAELLEPVFLRTPLRGSLELLLPALDLLTRALEALQRDPDISLMLQRLAAGERGPVAGYAHLRLGAVALQQHQPEQALEHARQALHTDRSDPNPALLEVNALADLERLEDVRATAARWRREAERHWPEETEFIRRMAAYEAHPEQAHPDWMRDTADEPGRS